jgi:hypothetical protein
LHDLKPRRRAEKNNECMLAPTRNKSNSALIALIAMRHQGKN